MSQVAEPICEHRMLLVKAITEWCIGAHFFFLHFVDDNTNRKEYGKVICVLKRNGLVGFPRHSTKKSVYYFEVYTITDNCGRGDEMIFMFI